MDRIARRCGSTRTSVDAHRGWPKTPRRGQAQVAQRAAAAPRRHDRCRVADHVRDLSAAHASGARRAPQYAAHREAIVMRTFRSCLRYAAARSRNAARGQRAADRAAGGVGPHARVRQVQCRVDQAVEGGKQSVAEEEFSIRSREPQAANVVGVRDQTDLFRLFRLMLRALQSSRPPSTQ